MAPVEITDDYYAVLRVSNDANDEVIRKSYLRLAITLHPDKNPKNPSAKAAFQLLLNAYETLKCPTARRVYDIKWSSIKQSQRAQSTQEEARKREAANAEAEQKRAAAEKGDKQKEESARRECLRQLEVLKTKHDGDIFETKRAVRRLAAALESLRREAEDYERKERSKNSWWTYMTSPIYGKVKETEEQKREREFEWLRRLACQRVKETQLAEKEAALQKSKDALNEVDIKIAAIRKQEEDEARLQAEIRREKMRKEEEARRRAEEEQRRKREAEWQDAQMKQRQEQAARAAKAAREAREFEQEQTRKRQAEWEEAQTKRRQEAAARAAEMAQEARKFEEAQTKQRQEAAARAAKVGREARMFQDGWAAAMEEKAQKARQEGYKPATPPYSFSSCESTCRHDQFWPKVEGRRLCENCHITQGRFTFQCPGCGKVACASCRQTLRGEKRRTRS